MVNIESIYGFIVNCGFFVLVKKGSIFYGRNCMKVIVFLKNVRIFWGMRKGLNLLYFLNIKGVYIIYDCVFNLNKSLFKIVLIVFWYIFIS